VASRARRCELRYARSYSVNMALLPRPPGSCPGSIEPATGRYMCEMDQRDLANVSAPMISNPTAGSSPMTHPSCPGGIS
jgi:hypothetical protein